MIKKLVDIKRLRENIIALKGVSQVKFCAVVKANAYGHGAWICKAIDDIVDFFAVAKYSEAMELVRQKVHSKILILGKVDYENLHNLIRNGVRLTVDNVDDVMHIEAIASALKKRAYVHIKINTGMNRLGVKIKSEFLQVYNLIKSCKHIIVEGIYTHFATADCKNSFKLKKQNAKFQAILEQIPQEEREGIILHASNSSAFLKSSKYKYDMIRVGIAMYGYDQTHKIPLRPALTIRAKIVKTITLQKGESVGYGAEFVAPHDMTIAVVAMGYADGYLRAYNAGYVLINGQRAKIVGRICMDMFMCDITNIVQNKPHAREGKEKKYSIKNCADIPQNELNNSIKNKDNLLKNDVELLKKEVNLSGKSDEKLAENLQSNDTAKNVDTKSFCGNSVKNTENDAKKHKNDDFFDDFLNNIEKKANSSTFFKNDTIYKLYSENAQPECNIFEIFSVEKFFDGILKTLKTAVDKIDEELLNDKTDLDAGSEFSSSSISNSHDDSEPCLNHASNVEKASNICSNETTNPNASNRLDFSENEKDISDFVSEDKAVCTKNHVAEENQDNEVCESNSSVNNFSRQNNFITECIKTNEEPIENSRQSTSEILQDVNLFEWATVLGRDGEEEITARDLAKLSGSIEYEVLTNFNLIRED